MQKGHDTAHPPIYRPLVAASPGFVLRKDVAGGVLRGGGGDFEGLQVERGNRSWLSPHRDLLPLPGAGRQPLITRAEDAALGV